MADATLNNSLENQHDLKEMLCSKTETLQSLRSDEVVMVTVQYKTVRSDLFKQISVFRTLNLL